MKTGIEKTQALKRVMLPVASLFVNDLNPNVMSDIEFNLLYDNIERLGIVDAIMVRPVGDKYRIVGGAHRFEVAKLQAFEDVPCTIVDHDDFDDDAEKFQIVRMNVIRGQMTPDKFFKLYTSLSSKYTDEILKDSFGFADEAEFRRLLKSVQKGLPADMQEVFKEESKNVKTIDDLARMLNRLYTKYGDTLPYGYMLMDFGDKESVWLRMSEKTREALYEVGALCRSKQRTMDSILGGVVQLIASGEMQDQIQKIVDDTSEVVLDKSAPELPTEEFLASLSKG